MAFFKCGWVVGGLLLVACGGRINSGSDAGADGSPPPPPISDAQPPPIWDGGPPPPMPDGGECNNLSLLGPSVSLDQVALNPPPFPSGGLGPSQGTYELVAFTLYAGPNGGNTSLGTGQLTIQLTPANNGFDVQVFAVVSNQAPQRESMTLQMTGPNQATLTGYCPSSSTTQMSFYFDGQSLQLRSTQGNQSADEKFALVTK